MVPTASGMMRPADVERPPEFPRAALSSRRLAILRGARRVGAGGRISGWNNASRGRPVPPLPMRFPKGNFGKRQGRETPFVVASASSAHSMSYKGAPRPLRWLSRRLTILIAIVRQSAGSRYSVPSVRDSIAPGTCVHISSAMI